MNPAEMATALGAGLFVAMVVCLEAGYRIGRRQLKLHPEFAHEGIGAIEAAVFALLGLLLGFSFAGGTSRLDARRDLIVKEANAIGTAYLRVDLLASGDQPEMRRLFREYLDSRLRFYEKLSDQSLSAQELAHSTQIQQQIWTQALADGRADSSQNVTRMLLPAVNDMIDVTTSRSVALQTHLPPLILGLLISMALLSGLLAGYAMAGRKARSHMHMVIYAAVVAITIYAVLDLDYPRSGLIRLTAADNVLQELKNSMH